MDAQTGDDSMIAVSVWAVGPDYRSTCRSSSQDYGNRYVKNPLKSDDGNQKTTIDTQPIDKNKKRPFPVIPALFC